MTSRQEPTPDPRENTYVVDAESAAEMARLMTQDRVLTSGMGGIFPEQADLSNVQRVLDLACGPGGWPLEVAYTYSDMEVVGVDISERMIAYAQAQAEAQQRRNLSFRVMNILQHLDFPPDSFDLVNARFISSFMLREHWPAFFRECLRVLKPGGILRLTEPELGMTNKIHSEKIWLMLFEAERRLGLNFSPNGCRQGIIYMLPYLLQQAGLTVSGQMPHLLDSSFGTEAHESFYRDFATAFPLLEPMVVKTQMATQEEWRDLYHKALAEMYEEDYRSAIILLTVWGRRPA